ncbi:MAG TPA: DUF3572 family protein [Alphaproteobacteria bacterium]|nr:DUF3572 family protein [Alphaproteobacteria bacterium]
MAVLRSTWWDTRQQPRTVAVRAWGFVASNRPVLEGFLAATGLSRSDLEGRPIDRERLATVLDFLIANEARLLEFSRAADLPPEAAYEARRLLGRDDENDMLSLGDGVGRDGQHIGLA